MRMQLPSEARSYAELFDATNVFRRMQTRTEARPLAGFCYRVLIAVGIVALAVLAWRLSGVFILVFGGILLAAALRALTNFAVSYAHLPPRLALVLVVLTLLAGLVLAFWLIGAQVSAQVQELIKILPDALARTRGWLEKSTLGSALLSYGESIADGGGDALSGVAKFASGTFGALTDFIVILFLGLYLAAEPNLYRNGTLRLIPLEGRERAAAALDASGRALRKWLIGQLSAMAAVGVLTFIALKILGMPLALSLALIAALLEFVPFLGPIVSAVPAVLVAFTVSPTAALYVAIAYLVIHQLEGNVVMPIVQRLAVALPPALGIASVVVFGWLFGLAGVLFAVPLMVVVVALVDTLYVEGALEGKLPPRVAAKD
jgi:predicted PurR-regulated permease PerM